jgi:hypothetical protein
MLKTMLGQTMLDPSMLGPTMLGSTMLDPSMLGPTMLDPSMLGPTMLDPSMFESLFLLLLIDIFFYELPYIFVRESILQLKK